MARLLIHSFDQIRVLISKDLCWFLVYESVVAASEKLRLQCAPEDLEDQKAMLYDLALQRYLADNISRHLFKKRRVALSDDAFEEAKEYFAMQVPEVSTLQLSRYINYLEGWAAAHEDWTNDRPQSFEQLEIIY